tara:strand:- start:34 stop:240 length:207 start_codon:yes stop_codon:yes gene_type:complete
LIRVGYANNNGSSVVHETVDNSPLANASILALKESKSGDTSVDYFYMEMKTVESNFTDWERYAFIDQT